jgi:GT2 family glycosyltransferase
MKNPNVAVVIVTRNRPKPLVRCLKSLQKSSYKIKETVVVDNGSTDDTLQILKKDFPKVTVASLKTNTGAAAGRNRGAEKAKSEMIFFLDDDAFIEKETIASAVKTILTDPKIAIVQTKVLSSFNHKKILGIAHDINTTTSLITAFGINEIDKGQYKKVIDVPMVGTGWLIRRNYFEAVKGFDEKFFVPYEDSDISLRIRDQGWRIVFDPKSQIWHDDLKPTEINPRIRSIGIAAPERAYFVGRNKVYFMKKHSKGLGRIFFFGILLPLFIMYHSFVIITSLRFDILLTYYRGLWSGFRL